MRQTLPECLTAPLKADGEATVRAAVDVLIEEMKGLHGGNWTSHIDHQVRMVMIFEQVDEEARQ